MSTSNSGGNSSGIGSTSALMLLFIGLKLGHVIDWSWWWVISPFWISLGLLLLLLFIAGIVGALEK